MWEWYPSSSHPMTGRRADARRDSGMSEGTSIARQTVGSMCRSLTIRMWVFGRRPPVGADLGGSRAGRRLPVLHRRLAGPVVEVVAGGRGVGMVLA